jgi:hypothetical protein
MSSGISVGDLFVNLGIKGSEKTLGALSGVQKGLGETSHMALETKAAILAAVYAFGRLVEESGAAGTGLTNFNALTGVGLRTIQQYGYAAQQAGGSIEEMESTLYGLQSAMTKMLLGHGAPEGWQYFAKALGLTSQDALRYQQHPEQLIDALQKYASIEKNVGLKDFVLKSFGLNDHIQAAVNRQKFTPEILSRAPSYGNAEAASLDRANIAWTNLGQKIEMAFGHFNAKHGGQIVHDLTKITDQVVRLAEALDRIATKFKIFGIFSGVLEHVADSLTPADKDSTPLFGENAADKKLFSWLKKIKDLPPAKQDDPYANVPHLKPIWEYFKSEKENSGKIEVHQILNFNNDGSKHSDISAAHKRAAREHNNVIRQKNQGASN